MVNMYDSSKHDRGAVYSNTKFCYLDTHHPMHRVGGGAIESIYPF